MKTSTKFLLLVLISAAVLLLSVGVGSVFLSPGSIFTILGNRLFGIPLPEGMNPNHPSILLDVRLPRVFCAFLVGAALSVSGAVMQSVLQNPLASSYTLGVSSGAALGVAVLIVTGYTLPLISPFTQPLVGFVFGLGTVVFAIGLAGRIDKGLNNQTVVLTGMVISLFANALMTLISSLNKEYIQRLALWQMGSFSARGWFHAAVLAAVTIPGVLVLLRFSRELDALTFGEVQSRALGINVEAVKWGLIVLASLLTGVSVCFTGVIGFVDLVSPHLMRRVFGPAHKKVLPASALFGGAFLALSDTLARTLPESGEISVGAITALIGAPFFAYVFFRSRKKKGAAA